MPGAVAALRDLGVDPAGAGAHRHPLPRRAPRREAPFRAGPGRGVRRTALHAALRRRRCGRRRHSRAARRRRRSRRTATTSRSTGAAARYLVAADGLHSPVRRALGLDAPPTRGRRLRPAPPLHGRSRGRRTSRCTGPSAAEAYVTPVAPDMVGVAMLTSTRGSFDEHLRRFPALRDRLDGPMPLGDVLGAGPLRQRARRGVAGRVLLVGDAAGYVDALTGEGVALARGAGPGGRRRRRGRRPGALRARVATRSPAATGC